MMVSPLNPGSSHTYESLLQVIVHELTHTAVFYACGNNLTPDYQNGLAKDMLSYEAGQINENMRKTIKSSLVDKMNRQPGRNLKKHRMWNLVI